jgi:DNA-binding NarL/FixJ family response regulator
VLKEKIISNYFLIKKLRHSIIKKYKNTFKETIFLKLTAKEELILSYLLKNKRIKYITKQLNSQIRTTEKSISKLLDKTQTRNNKELRSLPWNFI